MAKAVLEHINITVSDPAKTAQWLCEVFDWKIRWQGDAIHGGITFHVGSDDTYLAIYSNGAAAPSEPGNYSTVGGLNHVGIVVEDLDLIEARVVEAGYKPNSHADYEPGKRFYFDDDDNIEFEIVSYDDG